MASAAAPRYTVDFPHQAPISTKVAGAAAGSSAWPARRAAANSASPSSSGMKPRVRRAVCEEGLHARRGRGVGPGRAPRSSRGGCAGGPQRVRQPGPLAGRRTPR